MLLARFSGSVYFACPASLSICTFFAVELSFFRLPALPAVVMSKPLSNSPFASCKSPETSEPALLRFLLCNVSFASAIAASFCCAAFAFLLAAVTVLRSLTIAAFWSRFALRRARTRFHFISSLHRRNM